MGVDTVGPNWSSETAELSDLARPATGQVPRDVLFLGFTAELTASAVSAARANGARVALIGDAPYGVYPAGGTGAGVAPGVPRAMTPGTVFAPRVALLLGDDTARLTVGALGGDGLWTTVACTAGASHAMLADLADWLESLPSVVEFPPWAAAHLRESADAVAERHITAPVGPDAEARLLHNLHAPLLDQLPVGPVAELQLHAPVVDSDVRALRALVDRLVPDRITLVLPPPRVGYDPDAVAAALAGRPAEIRIADHAHLRGGRLVQWRIGEHWTVLAGGAELTWRALGQSVSSGGLPELAVLGDGNPALLPRVGTPIPYEAVPATDTRAAIGADAVDARDLVSAAVTGRPGDATYAPPGPGDTDAESAPTRAVASPASPSPSPSPVRGEAPASPAPSVPSASGPPATVTPAAAPSPAPRPPDASAVASASPERPSTASEFAQTPGSGAGSTDWAADGLADDPADETPEFEGPFADVLSGLAASGWTADEQDGIWEVTGSFANPLPIAAQAVDGFAQVHEGVLLVRAASKGRWVFLAWDGRHVVMLKHDQPVWRTYRVDAPATPGSRFSGGSVAVPGLLATTPKAKGAPPVLTAMLDELGWDYPELVKRIFAV